MFGLLTRNSSDYLNTIYVFFYTIKKMYSVNLHNLGTTKYAVGKYVDQFLIHTATNIRDLCCNKQSNLCLSFLDHCEFWPCFLVIPPSPCPHPPHQATRTTSAWKIIQGYQFRYLWIKPVSCQILIIRNATMGYLDVKTNEPRTMRR